MDSLLGAFCMPALASARPGETVEARKTRPQTSGVARGQTREGTCCLGMLNDEAHEVSETGSVTVTRERRVTLAG